ncbi:MAG: hypothetical protein JST40_06115 [Armatimonadetes bacterium]|nr:hypothetical protein [Armatimonadota bacterium]
MIEHVVLKISRFNVIALGSAILGVVAVSLLPSTGKTASQALDHPTYADLQPFFARKCLPCHTTGGTAPFPLERYEHFAKRGKLVTDMVVSRRMPPVAGSSDLGSFGDLCEVTDDESLMVQRWVLDKMPKGNPTPPPLVKPVAPGAVVAKAKLKEDGLPYVLQIRVPAPAGLDFERNWEVSTSAPQAVRQIVFFYDVEHQPPISKETLGEYPVPTDRLLAVWAPGTPTTWVAKPEGRPKDLTLLVLVQPSGLGENMEVRIRSSSQNSVRNPKWIKLGTDDWSLPPNTSETLVNEFTQATATRAYAVLPEAGHYLDRMQLTAGDGPDRKALFQARRWDYNWPFAYNFAEPVGLEPGLKLRFEAQYSNTEKCSANQNKAIKDVLSGYGEYRDRFWIYVLTGS